jgi:hypothetical protein
MLEGCTRNASGDEVPDAWNELLVLRELAETVITLTTSIRPKAGMLPSNLSQEPRFLCCSKIETKTLSLRKPYSRCGLRRYHLVLRALGRNRAHQSGQLLQQAGLSSEDRIFFVCV